METVITETELKRQTEIRKRDYALVRKARQGDKAATTTLIKQMNGILRIHAKKNLLRYGLEFDESMQYGMMGILRAIEKFDCDKGANFCTYASTWIRVMSLGPRGRNTLDFAHSIEEKYEKSKGDSAPAPTPPQLTYYPTTEHAIDTERSKRILDEAIDRVLRPLEASVIRFRMRGLSFEDIACEFGVSRQRIQQVDSDAMKKLRKMNLGAL